MQCKHCNEEITSIDNATNHPCFIGQDIYMDDENNLYTNNVEQTIHTKEKDKQRKYRNFLKYKIFVIKFPVKYNFNLRMNCILYLDH